MGEIIFVMIKMRICVIGCGYVGLATAVAFSKSQIVTIHDSNLKK